MSAHRKVVGVSFCSDECETRFHRNLTEVQALLAEIGREVEWQRVKPGQRNYGDVGSLSHVRDELLQVAQFLGIRKEGA
jgi:hypothetical protein